MLLLIALIACGDKDTIEVLDADGDGYDTPLDCDDTDPTVNPEGEETCNGKDDDCNGMVDDDPSDGLVWHEDADLDGYGDPLVIILACDQPDGWVDNTTDCDDDDATVHPDADELCDGLDNDCDDDVDEDPVDTDTWYRDVDEDGYGTPDDSKAACDQPAGYVADATDCDDADSDVYPTAPELCNDEDDDCDDQIDEDPTDGFTWYVDGDADGFGDDSEPIYSCVEEEGTIAQGGDCDDDAVTVYPGADEICGDGLVNDCDGDVNTASAVCGGWGDPVDVEVEFLDGLFGYDDGYLGSTLAGGLDVDGNGLDDVLIGAFQQDGEGVVFVVRRDSATGPIYYDAISGQAEGYGLGSEVAALGDLDGDGQDEYLVAATLEGDRGQGMVYLFPGGPGPAFGDAIASWEGDADGEIAGAEALAALGDVDDDGKTDFVVGARYGSVGATYAGQAYIVSGSATGANSLADASARLYSTGGYGYAASRVAGPGDLDGDGVADVVVDAMGDDAAWIALGPFSGDVDLSADADFRVLDGSDLTLSDVVGRDLDGDGIADLVLSSIVEETHAERAGAVFLHLGPWTSDVEMTDADATILGESAEGYLGGELALLDDVDGDDQVDLLVGTGSSLIREGSLAALGGRGRAYLFSDIGGRAGGLVEADADLTFINELSGDTFGMDVSTAGDVNADGRTDLLMAGPEATWAGGLGDAWVVASDLAY